jgi:hypothetical protein
MEPKQSDEGRKKAHNSDLKLGRTDFSENPLFFDFSENPLFFEPLIDHNLPLYRPYEMSYFTMSDMQRVAEEMLNHHQQHHHNNNSKENDITCEHIHSCAHCKYMAFVEFIEMMQQEQNHRFQMTWSGFPLQPSFSYHNHRYHRSQGIDGLSMKQTYVLKRFFARCHAKLQRKQLSLFQ